MQKFPWLATIKDTHSYLIAPKLPLKSIIYNQEQFWLQNYRLYRRTKEPFQLLFSKKCSRNCYMIDRKTTEYDSTNILYKFELKFEINFHHKYLEHSPWPLSYSCDSGQNSWNLFEITARLLTNDSFTFIQKIVAP